MGMCLAPVAPEIVCIGEQLDVNEDQPLSLVDAFTDTIPARPVVK